MSDEIVKYDDSYLATLSDGNDSELSELAQSVDPLALLPRLSLPSDGTRDLKCTHGEDTLFTKKRVIVIPVFVGERRALWSPEGRELEENAPICSRGVQKGGTFARSNDTGVGRWHVEGNEDLPFWSDDVEESKLLDNVDVSCRSCKWNRFDTASKWDDASSSSGKACKEGRVLALRVADEAGQMQTSGGDAITLYSFNSNTPIILMNLPATSIKAVNKMINSAVARRVPLSRMAFAFTAEVNENGSRKWATLASEWLGYIARDVLGQVEDDRDFITSALVHDKDATSHANTDDVEVPF